MKERHPCKTANCVRILGHAGAHTRWPGPSTGGWDLMRTAEANLTLWALDFPTPDLDDEEAA